MAEVKLHGFWYSPFAWRVKWLLELKGISYENIEEDRFNKTPELLQYNPVYKRIPVLVHAGKPISESIIILEYIDQVWPHNPLFPPHPYHRALARFWIKYSDDHLTGGVRALFRSNDVEGRKKIIEDIWEHLRVVEDQCFSKENKFFGGDSVNVVDLAFGSIINYLTVLEDIFEVQILEAQKFPRLYLWFNIFKTQPIIAENLPHQDQMKALYSQAMKISEMRDSVNKKRIELEYLRRSKTLSRILEAQVPYLDEWSTMTEEYTVSITEAIQALVNASVQLPVGGNVRVDVREVGDALNSALKMLETMISNIQRFVPKAEEIDISISELARIAGGERALVGECGDLLSKTYKSQVEECCLRAQQIQLHSFCLENKNK